MTGTMMVMGSQVDGNVGGGGTGGGGGGGGGDGGGGGGGSPDLAALISGDTDWTGGFGSFTASLTCNVTGGTAPYTYSWDILAGGGSAVINDPTASSITITCGLNPPTTLSCSVMDDDGNTTAAIAGIGN